MKKSFAKICALAVAGTMTFSLAACGTNQSGSSSESKAASETAAESEAKAAVEEAVEEAVVEEAVEEAVVEEAAAEAETAAAEETVTGETAEIEMYGLGFFGDNGLTEVMEEINKISEAEIGVHVNYHILDIATYMSQVSLMLSGGERMDLMLATAMPNVSYPTLLSQKQLSDITDLLPEYAPELMEMMEDYIPAMTVDGAVYGVPVYRTYNSAYYVMMRKDVLEALNLVEEAEAIDSWSSYKALLEKVRDGQDQLPEELKTPAMICNGDTAGGVLSGRGVDFGADSFTGDFGFDCLGDSNRIIRVTDEGVVENFFEDPDYATVVERASDWYADGLIYKDAATEQQGADQLIGAGITFSSLLVGEAGVQQSKEAATGHELVIVKIVDTPIDSSMAYDWSYVVPVTAEEPEAAVKFMNLMYTDPAIENLFVYGIEGRDYDVVDGEAVLREDRLYQNSDFLFGNQFNAYPAQGSGANFREEAKAEMEAAELSPFYGCVVDPEPVANEITALTQVVSQYKPALESGLSGLEGLEELNTALEAAGLQTFLDYYQESLDAWMAENQ